MSPSVGTVLNHDAITVAKDAHIDGRLLTQTAVPAPAPAPSPALTVPDVTPSATISQLGESWPVAGRIVGIVVGADSDPAAVATLRTALDAESIVPLVVAPTGGKLGDVTIHRTYANAASIEFDALIVVGDAPPAADAVPTADAKAGAGAGEGPDGSTDPRVVKLLAEAWRHAKPLGSVQGMTGLASAGLFEDSTGVASGEAADVAAGVVQLLAQHRVWERFTSAV